MMTPVQILTITLFAINLNPVHGTVFNEQFVSSEHYIDKSLLLRDFFQRDHRVFVTVPSGFGKTTNLNMLKKFCQIELNSNDVKPIPRNETNAYKIFKKLKIAEYENIVTEHLAQHSVIFLDMKLDIEENGKLADKQTICQKYRLMLMNAVSDHKSLIFHLIRFRGKFEDENIAAKFNKDYHLELDILSRLVKGEHLETKCDHDLDRVIFQDCISFLSTILHEYYNNSVVLLIDNYDYIVHKSILDPKGGLDLVNELLRDNIMTILQDTPSEIGYIMIQSVTTIGFRTFGLDKYLTGFYFYDDHPYTSHYGLTQQEVDNLLEKFKRDESDKSLIKQHCNGYESKIRHQSIYNISCTIDYLKNNIAAYNKDTQFTCQTFDKPSNFIMKIFEEPEYLDQVCRLIKHCPTRHGSHEIISVPQFFELIKDEPKFTSGLNCTAISFLIQQGFLGPIRGRYAFHIPNQPMRHRFITHLQYYFEKVTNIDLKLVGSYLYDIFVTIKANRTDQPTNLDQYLTNAFGQLKPLNISNDMKHTNLVNRTKKIKPTKKQTISTRIYNTTLSENDEPININRLKTQPSAVNRTEASQKFIHQSIIHIGALTNPYLKVIEDYPQPISYEKSTANVDRRCVTCITHDNIALIIKNTDSASLKVGEERARKFYKYSQPGIDHVWYLTIHIDDRKQVSSKISKNVAVPVNGSRSKGNRTRKNKAKRTTTTALPLETNGDDEEW